MSKQNFSKCMANVFLQLFSVFLFLSSYSFAFAAITITQGTGSPNTPTISQGTTYSQYPYFTASGGTAPYTFTVTSFGGPGGADWGSGGGFVFNSNGTLSGLTCLANGNATYTVTVTDANNVTASRNLSNTVNRAPAGTCGSLSMTSPAPTGATVGGNYNQTNTASGGTGPYTYTISSGSLPPGTSINSSTGAVTGTPTTPGPYTYVVTATDTLGNTASNTITVTIPAATLGMTSAAATGTTVDGNYNQTNTASGGTGPYTYTISSGSLPPGTSINSSTGAVTGTPTSAGTYNYSVRVTDSNAATVTNPVTAIIAQGTQAPLTVATSATSITTAETATLSTSGGSGTGSVSYTVVSGPCTVSGNILTPTGSGTCVVSATKAGDSDYASANSTNQVSVTVTSGTNPVTPAITLSASSTSITTGQTSTLTVGNYPNASSGTVTYAVLSGPCTVSGNTVTPTGTGSCVVEATQTGDSTYAPSTSNTVNISVTAPPTLLLGPASIPAGTVGAPYSQTFIASGGTPGYTYSINTAPPGMTFNSATGVLSGTPTLAGSYTFQICATDQGSPVQQTCQTYTLNVTANGFGITTEQLPTPTLGANYNQPIATTEAIGTVTYAITAGVLPAGLALNTQSGVISGISQTAGCYNFTITATDSGRVSPNNTTSRDYSFCVTRPNPADDTNVRGIISSQARSAYRFARGQEALIQAHLERLHDDEIDECDDVRDPKTPSIVRDFCITFNNGIQLSTAQRPQSQNDRIVGDLRKLNDPFGGSNPNTTSNSSRTARAQRQESNGLSSNQDHQDLASLDDRAREFTALVPENTKRNDSVLYAKQKIISNNADRMIVGPRIRGNSTKINVWTAGQVEFGRYDNQGRLLHEKFNVGGVATGIDIRVNPKLKVGVAFGYGNDYANINFGNAYSQATNFSGSLYASYKIVPGIFLDGVAGYGNLNYTSSRLAADGMSWLIGNRGGYAFFEAMYLTAEQRYGAFKIAPYLGVAGAQIQLGQYSESGNYNWALGYLAARSGTVDAIGGVRASYDYALANGLTLTPNVRSQFQKFFTGSVSQFMSYTQDPTLAYNYTDFGQLQWLLMTTVGMQVTGKDGVQLGVDYINSTAGTRYLTNGIRANIRVPF